MSIKCGTCHERHATVAEVRACSLNPPASAEPAQQQPYDPRVPANDEPPATEKQINFMLSLEASKIREVERSPYAMLEGMTKKAASDRITELLKLPNLPAAKAVQPELPDVPAGRYAVGDPLRFYRVDRPTMGRWAGYTFVKVQASDELHPVNRSMVRSILTEIARDPRAAMLRYGKEIGKCGHCGRTLTNEVSRARGIGPICAGRMNWLDLVDDSEEDDGPTEAEMDAAGVPEWTLS